MTIIIPGMNCDHRRVDIVPKGVRGMLCTSCSNNVSLDHFMYVCVGVSVVDPAYSGWFSVP